MTEKGGVAGERERDRELYIEPRKLRAAERIAHLNTREIAHCELPWRLFARTEREGILTPARADISKLRGNERVSGASRF